MSLVDLIDKTEGMGAITYLQYTGLHDKNGKEIYEGDRITGTVSKNKENVCSGVIAAGLLGQEVTGFVNYSTLYAQFYFTMDEIIYLDLAFGIRDYEIIGNIYEHPYIQQPIKP